MSGATEGEDALDVLAQPGYLDGFITGRAEGIEIGRRQAEEEIATLQRTAAEVVHGLARIDPWPEQIQRVEDARKADRDRFLADHERRLREGI